MGFRTPQLSLDLQNLNILLCSPSTLRIPNLKMPLIDPVTMSATAETTPPKASLPIELLPTDLARLYTHVHPALLLSAYYLRFPALVSDPVSTLLNSLIPLAVIQMSYVIICLPVTGSSTKPLKKPKPGAARKQDSPTTKLFVRSPTTYFTCRISRLPMLTAYLQTVFVALIFAVFFAPILTSIQILFGAPLTTHLPHTLLSSLHLSFLAIFPLIYVHGLDSTKWREVAAFWSPIDEVFGAAVGCFLGAWLGAVPIPLDWDREWQKWPVTIVTGAYAGYVLGKEVGGRVLRGKRIEFD